MIGNRINPEAIGYDNIAKEMYKINNLQYHNWDHITYMLDILSQVSNMFGYVKDSSRLQTAIIWHDVVYTPGASDNEEKSYELYESIRKYKSDEVKNLIMSTKDHIPVTDTFNEKLIIDLDLYGLGSVWGDYTENGKKIWREYSGFFTWEQFLAGRIKFIDKFLSRDKIYHTGLFPAREGRARRNLMREKAVLENFEDTYYNR